MKIIVSFVRACIAAVALFLSSPAVWIFALGAGGSVMIVVGVRILAGDGWAYIASGVCLIALANLIRRGLTSG